MAGGGVIREYACYLFDMDGTLMDTSELIYRSFLHTLDVYRIPQPGRNEITAGIGIPLKKQFEQFTGPLSEPEFLRIYETYNTYQKKLTPRCLTVFPGVRALLTTLKGRNKKLAVVTSRKRASLEGFLALKDMNGIFDALVTPESTTQHKPHPEPVLQALKELEARPEEALFVGDSVWDIESGRAAAVDTALVTWSNTDHEALTVKPTYLAREPAELIRGWGAEEN
jgi:pyrophosphatase PpaX